MARGSVTILYRPVNPAVNAIDVQGELTAFAEKELLDVFDFAAASLSIRAVILNFTRMAYMTSSGVGLLVTLFIRANRQGKRLFAVGLNEHFQHIFILTRLNETIPVFQTEEEALAHIQLASPPS